MICNGPGGPFCLILSPSFLVWFSCPQVVERDPSYPPLADSPSLSTPSRIGRMASWQEGGGRDFFLAFGGSTRSPFSRRGLALDFSFVLFVVSVLCALLTYVCYWIVFYWVFDWLILLFVCSSARPWFLIRQLVVRWLALLSLCGPASCLCSVLLRLSLVTLVALRRVVSFRSSARAARLSCVFL